ncbi:MAG: ketopantoate reductase family protein [Promethearchaeota archaeon]
MLQDILKGKPTEIDFLNGKIVEYANKLDKKVPINELLTFLIKGLERTST